MAKRFRHYFKQGWVAVTVPRANVHNWEKSSNDFGNDAHFKELNEWCANNFPNNLWASRYRNWEGAKEFVFREEKHANWFRLKWSFK